MNYTQYKTLDEGFVKRKISIFLAEDIPQGDATTDAIFNPSTQANAVIQTQERMIFAGRQILPYFFGFDSIDEDQRFWENGEFVLNIPFDDGEFIENEGVIATVAGSAKSILSYERVILNLLQRLSGIATTTKQYVDVAAPYGVKILDTRKTTPGLRLFEKYAVTCGGGTNHRLDLSSGILIKDNHIEAAGSISKAIEKVKSKRNQLQIEVEVENFNQLAEAINAGADAFLLDNMTPVQVKEAVGIIRSSANSEEKFIEASGGINIDTIGNYVSTGIDAISVGALTHSAKSIDIHMEFVK